MKPYAKKVRDLWPPCEIYVHEKWLPLTDMTIRRHYGTDEVTLWYAWGRTLRFDSGDEKIRYRESR